MVSFEDKGLVPPGSVDGPVGRRSSGAATDVYANLIARIEGATDRLDSEALGLLLCAMHRKTIGGVFIATGDDGSDELQVFDDAGAQVWIDYRHLAPDASLDAAVMLIERTLPNYWWLARSDEHRGGYGNIGPVGTSPNWGGPGYPSYAKTAPLALCLAAIRALIATGQEGSDDGDELAREGLASK